MPEIALIAEGAGAVRIVPCTGSLSATVFPADDSAQHDYDYVKGEKTSYANDDASSTEYFENEVGNQRKLRYPKEITTIDLASGEEADSASGSSDQVTFTVFVSQAQKTQIIGYRNAILIVAVSWIDKNRAHVSTEYLVGKLSGEIAFEPENGMLKANLTIVGKAFTTAQDETVFNTAVGTNALAVNTRTDLTLPAITSGNLDDLKLGRAVEVAAA